MQGSWNNETLNYRCRFPSEYAMTEEIDHPLNVYVRQDAIEPLLDEWLIEVFDADNVQETCASLAAAECKMSDGDLAREKATRLALTDCDRRLEQYRRVLDEGGDPATVAGWIAKVKADRLAAEATLAQLAPRHLAAAQ